MRTKRHRDGDVYAMQQAATPCGVLRDPFGVHARRARLGPHRGGRSEHASNAVLAGHVAAGGLLRVQRGLHATVPPGAEGRGFKPDSYLVARKLRPDAVVADHAVLAFHGKACSAWRRHHCVTAARARAP